MNRKKEEDQDTGWRGYLLLVGLLILMLFLGYVGLVEDEKATDKENVIQMMQNPTTMEVPKKMKSPKLSPEVDDITENV